MIKIGPEIFKLNFEAAAIDTEPNLLHFKTVNPIFYKMIPTDMITLQ